jgi:hypothetical protein
LFAALPGCGELLLLLLALHTTERWYRGLTGLRDVHALGVCARSCILLLLSHKCAQGAANQTWLDSELLEGCLGAMIAWREPQNWTVFAKPPTMSHVSFFGTRNCASTAN